MEKGQQILRIRYYKPRALSISFDTVEDDEVISSQTLVREKTRKKSNIRIPAMPKIHPQTFIDLSRLAIEQRLVALVPVALYVAACLTTKNSFEAKFTAKQIEKDLGLSDKSVTKALGILEELGYLTFGTRGHYLISPRLAFFGEPLDWGIALEFEQEGQDKVKEQILNFHERAANLNKLHNVE